MLVPMLTRHSEWLCLSLVPVSPSFRLALTVVLMLPGLSKRRSGSLGELVCCTGLVNWPRPVLQLLPPAHLALRLSPPMELPGDWTTATLLPLLHNARRKLPGASSWPPVAGLQLLLCC